MQLYQPPTANVKLFITAMRRGWGEKQSVSEVTQPNSTKQKRVDLKLDVDQLQFETS